MEFEDLALLFVSTQAEFGTATVWVDPVLISVLAYNGSADEDLAIAWAGETDGCELLGCYALDDGRDLILLKRLHTKQSILDAVLELQEAIEKRFA